MSHRIAGDYRAPDSRRWRLQAKVRLDVVTFVGFSVLILAARQQPEHQRRFADEGELRDVDW
jgi:hypothetical protein